MKELIINIEKFNCDYRMSSSGKQYDKWNYLRISIQREMRSMTNEELLDVYSSLSENGKKKDIISEFVNKLEEVGEFNAPTVEEMKSPISEKLSNVMRTAWALIKSGIVSNISEALKLAWMKIKLSNALKNGMAYFTYKKTDGSVRDAIGTLRVGNLEYKSKSTGREKNASILSYFDLEKRSFRSFRIENLTALK